jgi:hypothetical protein
MAEATLAQGTVEHEAITAAIEMDRNALKNRRKPKKLAGINRKPP